MKQHSSGRGDAPCICLHSFKLEELPRGRRHHLRRHVPFSLCLLNINAAEAALQGHTTGRPVQATVPFLLAQPDARRWEERRGGGELNKTFKNKILAGTSPAQITKGIGILFC